MTFSLLDTADRNVSTWYLHYTNSDRPTWWTPLLREGFHHVQIYRPMVYGPELTDRAWLSVDPGLDSVNTYIDFNPEPPWARDPKATVQRVTGAPRNNRVRQYFFAGPISCVEIVKAHLGIAAFWVRTPWQLYRHVRANKYFLR